MKENVEKRSQQYLKDGSQSRSPTVRNTSKEGNFNSKIGAGINQALQLKPRASSPIKRSNQISHLYKDVKIVEVEDPITFGNSPTKEI